MCEYYREKSHVNHFWELKGQEMKGNTKAAIDKITIKTGCLYVEKI